jgi:nitrate reductase gamma subunit
MTVVPYVVAYVGIAIFLLAVVVRIIMWVKMPVHVRWELYPVAHEGKKISYGGGYLEDSEWWKQPREVSLISELKVMIPEILFLVALREHNPKMWLRSFPFHFGLYLVIGCTVLMALSGLLGLNEVPGSEGALGQGLSYGIFALGVGGLLLGLVGAAGLLIRRLRVWELREFSAPVDFLNLILFVIVFGFSLVSVVGVSDYFATVTATIANLLRFNLQPFPGQGMNVLFPMTSVILMSGLLAYIPLTHMSHFIGKYFAYHSVRWNDTPNLPGSGQEAEIKALLSRRVSWAAAHIQGDGKKTWADVATSIPTQEEKK